MKKRMRIQLTFCRIRIDRVRFFIEFHFGLSVPYTTIFLECQIISSNIFFFWQNRQVVHEFTRFNSKCVRRENRGIFHSKEYIFRFDLIVRFWFAGAAAGAMCIWVCGDSNLLSCVYTDRKLWLVCRFLSHSFGFDVSISKMHYLKCRMSEHWLGRPSLNVPFWWSVRIHFNDTNREKAANEDPLKIASNENFKWMISRIVRNICRCWFKIQ